MKSEGNVRDNIKNKKLKPEGEIKEVDVPLINDDPNRSGIVNRRNELQLNIEKHPKALHDKAVFDIPKIKIVEGYQDLSMKNYPMTQIMLMVTMMESIKYQLYNQILKHCTWQKLNSQRLKIN